MYLLTAYPVRTAPQALPHVSIKDTGTELMFLITIFLMTSPNIEVDVTFPSMVGAVQIRQAG